MRLHIVTSSPGSSSLNSGYDDNFPVLWPEMVTLFATKELGALAQAVAQSPQ